MPGITRKGGRSQRTRRNKKIRSRKGRQASRNRRIGGGPKYKFDETAFHDDNTFNNSAFNEKAFNNNAFNENAFNDDENKIKGLQKVINKMYKPVSNSNSKDYGIIKLGEDGAGLISDTHFVLGTTNATGFVNYNLNEDTGKITCTFSPDDKTNDWKFKGDKLNTDVDIIKKALEDFFIIKVDA